MTQLEQNIAFCIDEMQLDDDQIGDMLRAIEDLGVQSVEYFCEEFIFDTGNPDDIERLHDPNYLTINWGLN